MSGVTLYVKEQGATVRRTHERLLVVKDDELLATVRLRELERVVLFGSVQLTSAAMVALLEAGIETSILSLSGRLRGRLAPADSKNIFLRQAQFRRYDDMEFRLTLARTIVEAKIRNARVIVQRHHRNHPSPVLEQTSEQLERMRARVSAQTNLDSLLGAEGEAAKAYFAALGTMVRSEFAFTGRTRRPPGDPVNALLSFGYTLFLSESAGAVASAGLDPHVGYLHDLSYGRPSLALDLVEEFRQPVIDRLVLSLVNRGVIAPEHFDNRGKAGVLLNDQGRPRFLEFYHRTMSASFPDGGAPAQPCTFRTLLQRQAGRLRQAILGEADYEPFAAR